MSQTESISRSDAELIAAIREGDRELFRELVERHSQTVFGIAWSRLGNHSLAEEAAQETFIKAYKRLGLLHSSEKFSGWLATIARHVAINLGMRHRREMDKRDRWKLEQVEEGGEEGEGELTNETIQQTLTNLPTVHRETLVLYYLEGKSIAEAARAIGISETAFKTRLHRARECMRSALESRLESSLEQLRPSGRFAAGVMMALPMQGPASLAGGGMLGGLLKFVPAMWPLLLIQIIAFIPEVLVARWILRKQRENFTDPKGFRARNMAVVERSAMWGVPLILLGVIFLTHSGLGIGGGRLIFWVVAGAVLLCAIWGLRRLRLVWHRDSVRELLAVLVVFMFFATFDQNTPTYYWMGANAVSLLLLSGSITRAPLRMDYSLFLRAAEGLLPQGAQLAEKQEYSREDLFRFAKFMAERFLVMDWRWKGDELQLRLTPVTPKLRDGFFPFIWRNHSELFMNGRGEVRATIGSWAMKDLQRLGIEASASDLCEVVSRNVARALEEHREGKKLEAEAFLGEEASEKIYRRAPEKTKAVRVKLWLWRGMGLLMLIGAFFSHRDYYSGRKFGLAPVELNETEFRQALEDTLLSTNRYWVLLRGPYVTVKFPEGRFFSGEAVTALHDLLRSEIAKSPATERLGQGSKALLDNKFIQRALYSGLLSVKEFPSFGISVEELKREIGSWSEKERQEYIELIPGRVGQSSYTIFNTSDLNLRVAMLAHCGLLKEFDFSETISLLTASQIIEEKAADNRWEDLDAEALRGLFLMVHRNPLRDTYDTLCILKEVGGLDQIDREECIQGLLRFHKGRGLFRKELPGEVNWNIRGGAHDAYCVVESLRMLDAVDRIRDLRHWQFRTSNYRKSENALPPWETLEAYGLEQRVKNELGMKRELR